MSDHTITSAVNAMQTVQPFQRRLRKVQAEVRIRTSTHSQSQHNGYRAHLWCNWIKRNVLEVSE